MGELKNTLVRRRSIIHGGKTGGQSDGKSVSCPPAKNPLTGRLIERFWNTPIDSGGRWWVNDPVVQSLTRCTFGAHLEKTVARLLIGSVETAASAESQKQRLNQGFFSFGWNVSDAPTLGFLTKLVPSKNKNHPISIHGVVLACSHQCSELFLKRFSPLSGSLGPNCYFSKASAAAAAAEVSCD